MMLRATWHRRRDEGFTLIETVVVVVMIGLVAAALAAVFGVIVRTTPATTARADDARSLLGITTWLTNDVSGTPMVPLATAGAFWDKQPETASGCAGVDLPGYNLVRLGWSETYSGTRTYRSAYRLVDDGDSSYIARVYCLSGQTPTVSKLTADLPPIDELGWIDPVTWKTQSRGGVEYLVGLVLEVDGVGTDASGPALRVDAVSKNLNESLDAPIPPPDYVPLAPPPPPDPVPNTAPVASDVSATFRVGTPIVVTLVVSDDYDDPATLVPTITLPSELIADGWTLSVDPVDTRVVTFVPPGVVVPGALPPIDYTVVDSGQPDASALTSNTATISLTLTTDPVPLPEPPVITPGPDLTFQRDGVIGFVVDATDPDGDDAGLVVTLEIPDAAADPRFAGWGYHIDPADNLGVVIDGAPFVAGTYDLTYRVTDETGLWAESNVTINLTAVPCSAGFLPAPMNPTTANRQSNANGGRRLAAPVDITITRAGDCGVLVLEYRPIAATYTQPAFTQVPGQPDRAIYQLPATDAQLWDKNTTTSLRLVRTDEGAPQTLATWSLFTP